MARPADSGVEKSCQVSTQTSVYQPGSLQSFCEACESHKRQVQSMISVQRKARERTLRIKSAHPDRSLLCPICKHLYEARTRPALALPCGHAICRECMMSAPRGRLVTCSLDSKVHIIPPDLFPTDYLLMELVEKARSDPEFLCTEHQAAALGFCRLDSSLLCGECVFLHKLHDCIAFQSPEFDDLAKAQHQRVNAVLEQCKEAHEGWMGQATMFDMYCMQFTCTPLANCVGWKEVMAVNTGMPLYFTVEETLFKLLGSMLVDLRRLHYELLESSKERVRTLERLSKDFSTFSAAEKAMMDPGAFLTILNFEAMLNEFGMVINQANCYSSSQGYM